MSPLHSEDRPIGRRAALRALGVSAGATVLAAVMGSCDAGLRSVPLVGSYADGRLKSRPHEPSVDPPEPGRRAVRIEGAHALLSVPERQSAGRPLALALLLHGGSGHPGGGLRIWSPFRDDADIVMLAPQSNEGGAWDVMVADFGPDVAMIDGMLSWVFDRFRIDPLQLAVAGFSNGATYSLSLGLTNDRSLLPRRRDLTGRHAARWVPRPSSGVHRPRHAGPHVADRRDEPAHRAAASLARLPPPVRGVPRRPPARDLHHPASVRLVARSSSSVSVALSAPITVPAAGLAAVRLVVAAHLLRRDRCR